MARACALGSLPGMTSVIAMNGATSESAPRSDFVALARELGPVFASRAAAHDANDSFPVDNYRELKELQFFSAGVPAELGGGGASPRELCAMLRELGPHCGATALAWSMHTHLVGTTVWLWRQGAPVAPLLERIAREQLVLVTNGASDWLDSSGAAERVDGGFRITGRKTFSSGSPMGDLLLTSALYDDPTAGPTVLHFAVPMKAPGVLVLDTWRTMAMRASGSNDIMLEAVFVPDLRIVALFGDLLERQVVRCLSYADIDRHQDWRSNGDNDVEVGHPGALRSAGRHRTVEEAAAAGLPPFCRISPRKFGTSRPGGPAVREDPGIWCVPLSIGAALTARWSRRRSERYAA
jgi:hypothetical protein